MNTDRLERLKIRLKEQPEDCFSLYAISLEYYKLGNLDAANASFEKLILNHPDYLATYYQFAKLLIDRNEKEKAQLILDTGIILAGASAENKTKSELQNLKTNLEMDLI